MGVLILLSRKRTLVKIKTNVLARNNYGGVVFFYEEVRIDN